MGWRDKIDGQKSSPSWRDKIDGGSGASPSGPAQPSPDASNKDWVDYLKSAPEAIGKVMMQAGRGGGLAAPLGLIGAALQPTPQHYIGKAIDYPGGLARTILAKGVGMVTPGENPVGMQDFVNAAMGHAPGSGELAQRFGMPNPSVNIPGTNNKNVSLKDLADLIGNTVTNPLMYGAMGKAGEMSYESGLKKIDEAMEARGKIPLSETLQENSTPTSLPAGSTKNIKAQSQKLLDQKTTERSNLYDQVRQGPTKGLVDVSSMPKSEALLKEMSEDPDLNEMVPDLQKRLERHTTSPNPENPEERIPASPIDIAAASKRKSNLANALPSSYYDPQGRMQPWAKQFQDALASDYRQKIIDTGESHTPGMGKEIDNVNDTLGTLIESQKPLQKQIGRDTTKNNVTSPDAVLGYFSAPALALKKAADVAKGTTARTMMGKIMMIPSDADMAAAVTGSNVTPDNNNEILKNYFGGK